MNITELEKKFNDLQTLDVLEFVINDKPQRYLFISATEQFVFLMKDGHLIEYEDLINKLEDPEYFGLKIFRLNRHADDYINKFKVVCKNVDDNVFIGYYFNLIFESHQKDKGISLEDFLDKH